MKIESGTWCTAPVVLEENRLTVIEKPSVHIHKIELEWHISSKLKLLEYWAILYDTKLKDKKLNK
jgi:hypothetical protein